MTDFYNLVERLTRQHRVAVTTDNGVVFATEDGLLQQLRESVFGDNGTNSHTSSKARLPMNAPAADLLTLIDRQVAEVWGAVTKRVPGVERTEKLLTEWAAAVNRDSIVTVSSPEGIKAWDVRYGEHGQTTIWTRAEYLPEALLQRWVQSILDLFDPPRTAEILAACINCGEREVWRTKDGENTKQSAMVFVRDRLTGDSTEARCQVCGTSWTPDQFGFLAGAIAENERRHTVAERTTPM